MPVLDEANEGFGAPAKNERLEAATEALLSSGRAFAHEVALPLCYKDAERVGHESYTAALQAALDVASARSTSDPDAFPTAIRALFHAGARFGEARMLTHLAERVADNVLEHMGIPDGDG
ncbi:hypothetical protein [Antarcticirhabdus aurantiaca]|uniref:Uncharacterized protein n=1 Tax=Antarcticirhabdus aurantiaca TaxID=2606717 RepID=A0ACD4NQ55_9HYPH|nr:hypothetical protein [Antarcticirhabdus aurantiaca]WAJ28934.1 hypothetical protein OXU80_01375 [Jeongeuplla avenae]